MSDLTHWLPSIIAIVGAAAAWGSARTDLRQLREALTEHRHDAAASNGVAQAKLDTLLSHHAELTARVAVLERDVSHHDRRDSSADDTLRAHVAELETRMHALEAQARPSR
jgi:outer membrane murein-binding lipoprotein Lpp